MASAKSKPREWAYLSYRRTEFIDWHDLGRRLRAIDFHFLWMITAPESEWLWSGVILERNLQFVYMSDARREDFAFAARFIGHQDATATLRQCEAAHIRSQARRVGQIFESLESKGFVNRQQTKGRTCSTTLYLPMRELVKGVPTRGGAK